MQSLLPVCRSLHTGRFLRFPWFLSASRPRPNAHDIIAEILRSALISALECGSKRLLFRYGEFKREGWRNAKLGPFYKAWGRPPKWNRPWWVEPCGESQDATKVWMISSRMHRNSQRGPSREAHSQSSGATQLSISGLGVVCVSCGFESRRLHHQISTEQSHDLHNEHFEKPGFWFSRRSVLSAGESNSSQYSCSSKEPKRVERL